MKYFRYGYEQKAKYDVTIMIDKYDMNISCTGTDEYGKVKNISTPLFHSYARLEREELLQNISSKKKLHECD